MKLVIDEPGSDFAHGLWERADVVTSGQLAYPEMRAAAAAARRSGRYGGRWLADAVATVDEIYGELLAIALDDPLTRLAGDLAERHALRGYDAVHLAAALSIDVPGDLVIATWDRELAAAALAEGRAVVPADL